MTAKKKEADAAAEAPPAKNGFSPISGEKLIQLYSTMVQCRMLEERIGLLFRQGKLQGSDAAWAGQEAAVTGVVLDMLPEDALGLSGNGLIASFVKGVPLECLFRPLLTQEEAGADAGSSSVDRMGYAPLNVLASPFASVARQGRAAKVAQANKKKKNNRIVVAFCGEEPASQGSWHKTLRLAGAQDLPMIFVCLSGLEGEAENPKPSAQPGGGSSKPQEDGIPRIPVDGSDVVAVYRVASEAIARARRGAGPTIVECKADAAEGRKAGDPLAKMEKYLTGKGLFRENRKAEVGIQFGKDLDVAIGLAEKPQSPRGM